MDLDPGMIICWVLMTSSKIMEKFKKSSKLRNDGIKLGSENSPSHISNRNAAHSSDKFVTLKSLQTWPQYFSYNEKATQQKSVSLPVFGAASKCYEFNEFVNDKISIFMGDIVTLQLDGIVNAANKRLCGGGGVDGAIHRAAGKMLLQECQSLGGCATGHSVITKGYNLPVKYVIHTVGPTNGSENMLRSCYQTSLNLALDHKIRSIAFPCIATGVYNYPNEEAAKVALKTTRDFIEIHYESFDRIIFCLFMPEDKAAYIKHLPLLFPLS